MVTMRVVGSIFKFCFLKPLKLDKFKNQNLHNFNIKVRIILEYQIFKYTAYYFPFVRLQNKLSCISIGFMVRELLKVKV
jgi:hypothetical protein